MRHGAGLDWSRERLVDLALSALLALQGFTIFAAVPLAGEVSWGFPLLDGCHLAFTAICIGILTRHRALQASLVALLVLLAMGPAAIRVTSPLDATDVHETISLVAFASNAIVTLLIARQVFAKGRVNVHRVRGAILLYLNTSSLFAILFGAIAMKDPGAFVAGGSALSPVAGQTSVATFSYFSLATITTTGYGDIAPAHALARSLANLEAVIGQLFPATLLSRLVALHLAHDRTED